MYHAHFGLERGLFGEGIAADAAVYRAPRHDRLVAHFKLALASASSAIVLRGQPGVGKTTLTSEALRASSTRLALAWLNGMATNAAELLELILVELGVNTLRTTRVERLQLWRQFQGEMRATDSRLFVVVERTEDLPAEVLHALDQLTAPDAVGNSGANLVLLGHTSIDEHLATPLLDSLRQRIRFRAELEPFTEAELQDYLRHQVVCAGGQYDRIFAPGTVAALYRYSQGVARLANTLCESALDIAAVQQHKQLTAELVARTAVSLLGLADPWLVARPATTAPRVEPATPLDTRPAPGPAVSPAPSAAATVAAPPSAPAVVPSPSSAVAPSPVLPAAERPPEPRTSPATAVRAEAVGPSAHSPAAVLRPAEVEFDGGATDVADVAVADFPVLLDAVEAAAPTPAVKPAAAAPSSAAAPAAAPPSAAAARPLHRAEPPSRPAPKPAAPPAAPAAASMAPSRVGAAKPTAPEDSNADDVLRQTQTMRAIASAKSIDDISDVDAETLFGDAELDLVSAALASAAEWPDEDELAPPPARSERAKAAPAPRPEPPKAAAAPARPDQAKTGTVRPEAAAAPPADDPFDLFGLGEDAPLELIDDATLPPANPPRRSAVR